jgi:hypothetical protein
MSEEFSSGLDPDGWRRFEHAVDAALHKAPKPRESAKEKPRPKGS